MLDAHTGVNRTPAPTSRMDFIKDIHLLAYVQTMRWLKAKAPGMKEEE
jgi:hypothetical protein